MNKEILIEYSDGKTEILNLHMSGRYNGPATVLADTSKRDIITQPQRAKANIDMTAKTAVVETRRNDRDIKINSLKSALPGFDSMTATAKWQLVKNLIEVL